MIKVLLVDDDFLVRTYLSGLIDWNQNGFTLVGAAQDGEEALKMVEEYHPDIIIADISMPVLDGISLIRKLKQADNPAKIIMLSCHDDFEYVREAMKLGADEYVLKHLLTADKLLSLLDDLKKTIIHPIPRRRSPEKERECILKLLRGESGSGELEGFHIGSVIAVRIAEYESRIAYLPIEQQEHFHVSCVQVCQELSGQYYDVRCVHVRRDLYAVLVDFRKGESRMQRQEHLRAAAGTIAANLNRYLAVEAQIGVSDAPDFRADAALCWRQAKDALEETFYKQQTIFYAWQCQPSGGSIPEDARVFCNQIASMIARKDGSAIRAGYTAALDAFRREHTRSQLVKEWLLQADRMAGVSMRNMPQHFSGFEGQERAYLTFCEEMLPELEMYSEAVTQAVQYIRKNYMRNVTLNDAAEAVHLNAAYLSFVFHKETGITFSEYLTSCRINQAKELLTRTNDRIQDIAVRTGYNDKRYFGKTFKRITGMTPQEYRKQNSEGT